jgi:hypothetical protein
MWYDSADIYSTGKQGLCKTENRIRLGSQKHTKTETKGSINSQIEEGPTGQRAKKTKTKTKTKHGRIEE